MDMDEFIKEEIKFCTEELQARPNKKGELIYTSEDGKHLFNLPHILADYKEWLVEQEIVSLNDSYHKKKSKI